MRHGRLNVVTWVMVKGRLASGGLLPALTCAVAWVTNAKDSVIVANNFIGFPRSVSAQRPPKAAEVQAHEYHRIAQTCRVQPRLCNCAVPEHSIAQAIRYTGLRLGN
jgi:hypothetical protein